ncbi:MAG TPA: DUF2945 domain-containing protein [Candidatus Saccharimonadales bacterium]|jgi:hypothetical protein
MTDFSKVDKVSWNTPQGKTHGHVTRKLIDDTTVGGHHAKASASDPQYEVESDTSSKKAAHKPESLDKS